jgi:hypothetical protein
MLPEAAEHGRCGHHEFCFSTPRINHAEVFAYHDNAHPFGVNRPHHLVCDLRGEPFRICNLLA